MIVPTQTYESQYFQPVTLSPDELLVLQGAQGVGKTYVVSTAVKTAGAQKLLYITHRQSLAAQAKQDFDIPHYRDDDMKLETHTGSLAIVIDSLKKVTPAKLKGSVVFLDEFTQLFRHLTQGTLKDSRAVVLEALEYLLNRAEIVIAADADVNEPALALLRRWAAKSSFRHIHNTYVKPNRRLQMYESPDKLKEVLIEFLSQGKKLVVACNEHRRSDELRKELCKSFPDKVIKCINSDNGAKATTHKFYRDINKKIKSLDTLIFSPSMFTGIDISVSNYVDAVFLFGDGNHLPASDLVQAAHRVRNPTTATVHAFVTNFSGKHQASEHGFRKEFTQATQAPFFELASKSGKFVLKNHLQPFVDFWASVHVADTESRNALCRNFIEGMEAQHYTVLDGDLALASMYRPKRCEFQLVDEVETPSRSHYERLKEKQRLKPEEKAATWRYEYLSLLDGDEESIELLTAFKKKPEEFEKALDNFERLGTGGSDTWARLLKQIEASYGGFNSLLDNEVPRTKLDAFLQVCRQNEATLERRLEITVDKDSRNIAGNVLMKYLRAAFHLTALRVGTSRNPCYTLDKERYELMMRLCRIREARNVAAPNSGPWVSSWNSLPTAGNMPSTLGG